MLQFLYPWWLLGFTLMLLPWRRQPPLRKKFSVSWSQRGLWMEIPSASGQGKWASRCKALGLEVLYDLSSWVRASLDL